MSGGGDSGRDPEHPADQGRERRRPEPLRAPLLRVERVADRRADGLVDVALDGAARAEADLGEIGVVHVARERDDRGGRAPALPLADLGDQARQPPEALRERGPVVEVERLADLLAERRGRLAPGPAADGLVPGLDVVDPGREEVRVGHGEEEVVEVARGLLAEPVPLLVVDHEPLALLEDAARAAVDRDQARAPEVPVEAPAHALDLAVGLERELAQELAAVLRPAQARQERVLRELGRREVPQVLVEPVGHVGADDPLVPPGLLAHPRDPVVRDVPVVVDVVVVEEHRARDGGEKPADHGLLPRLPVEPRVLLEVGDLLARRLGGVAARADELERLRRDLVGVDLVADQEDRARPLVARLRRSCGGRRRAGRRGPGPARPRPGESV